MRFAAFVLFAMLLLAGNAAWAQAWQCMSLQKTALLPKRNGIFFSQLIRDYFQKASRIHLRIRQLHLRSL